jgi:hypothetical protein
LEIQSNGVGSVKGLVDTEGFVSDNESVVTKKVAGAGKSGGGAERNLLVREIKAFCLKVGCHGRPKNACGKLQNPGPVMLREQAPGVRGQ